MAGKMRVSELASELGIPPKLVIDQLEQMGYREKTSSSALDDDLVPVLREALADKAAEFQRREAERAETDRASALRARLEAVRATAAKATRARARKAEGVAAPARPRPARPRAAERPGTEKPPVRPRVVTRVVARPAEEPAAAVERPVEPAAAAPPAVEAATPSAPAVAAIPPVVEPAAPVVEPAAPVVVEAGPPPPVAPPVVEFPPAEGAPPRVEVAPPAEEMRPPAVELPRRAKKPARPEPVREGPPPGEPLRPAAPSLEEVAAAAPAEVPPVAAPTDGQVVAPRPPAPEPVAAPPAGEAPPAPPEAPRREVLRLTEGLTVAELAARMQRKPGEVIRELLGLGVIATVNQFLDLDKARAVATRFGFEVEARPLEAAEPVEEEVDPSRLRPRPPVVTVMGHVDHGKTSLLDAIRKTRLAEREHGGITQHIGAYQVETSHGPITFLDTPGHEAFTAMRARGAQVTDIVILVVAADDGVMPQTVEAINHARAAGVPILVAVNKIDKPEANPERVKRELSELGLVPEEWGGQTIFVETSAKKGVGIDALLEMTALQAEIMELRANPDRPARGVVVEAKLDRGRGPVATVLVQQGTLREGDVVVAGAHYGRVRALFNDRRQRVREARPADPVEVLGLSGVPSAGDTLVVVPDERRARQIALARQEQERTRVAPTVRVTLADLHRQIAAGEVKELRLILKTDVHGSREALQDALEQLSTDEVKVRVIHAAVGSVTETDVMLASASNAIIIGFNVRPEPKAQQQAQAERVDIRTYQLIYEAINDVRAALAGMLSPVIREVLTGKAEVRALFPIRGVGTVAGCVVLEGKVIRGGKVRLLRGRQVVGEGQVASLRRFKDDVREVVQGLECGIGVEGLPDLRVGDLLEVYTTEEVARAL